MRNPGKLVSQQQLLHEVWGPEYHDESAYLRVHMANLRRKLEPEPSRPRYFLTEPGMGYRFQPASTSVAAATRVRAAPLAPERPMAWSERPRAGYPGSQ